jgi:hypothetical protein
MTVFVQSTPRTIRVKAGQMVVGVPGVAQLFWHGVGSFGAMFIGAAKVRLGL